MKKRLLIMLTLLFALLLVFASCDDEVKNYSVSFDSNGAEEYSTRLVPAGSPVSRPESPTRAGYTFLGWFNGDVEWKFDTDKVTSDLKLTAKWDRITYNVIFDSNGGSAVSPQVAYYGEHISRPANPTKKDHRFIGWYNGEALWNFETDRVADYTTLTAKWDPFPTYTVSFDSQGGTSVESQYVVESYMASVPKAPTKANSKFIGWFWNDVEWLFDQNPITDNIILVAKWEPVITYTVTFNSNGGSEVATQNVPKGGKLNYVVPQPPSNQSVFLGWFDEYDKEWDFNKEVPNNMTLTAKWRNYYTVYFNTDGAGDLDPVIVEGGNKIPLPKTLTKAGHKFVEWQFGGVKWDFENRTVSSDVDLIAVWAPLQTFTIKFDTLGAETEKPADQYIVEGNLVTEPAKPKKTENVFLGWAVKDTTIFWDFDKHAATGNITLIAVWQPIPRYTVEFISAGSTLSSQSILENNKANEPAAPRLDGYRFDGWHTYNVDTGAVGAKWDFNTPITQNVSLIANWIEVVDVTFVLDFGDRTEVYRTLTVDKMSLIPIPAEPKKDGYLFRGWNDENGTPWNFNIVADKDITLTARMLKAYTVVFDFDTNVIDRENYVITVGEGEKIPKIENPNPKDPYEFDEWIIDGVDSAWDFDNDVVQGNVRLIATYSIFTPIDKWG